MPDAKISGTQQCEDRMSNDNAQTDASQMPAVVAPVERGVGRSAPERDRSCAQGCNGCDDCTDYADEDPHPDYPCRHDGRCQYAIDHGAEGLGHCPRGKCVMPEGVPQ